MVEMVENIVKCPLS